MRRAAIVGAGMTPFGEQCVLGTKDLLPPAFADCAAGVDKGVRKADLQAAWFGSMGTTDQVDAARTVLAHNIGGPTAVSAVTILEGPGDGE